MMAATFPEMAMRTTQLSWSALAFLILPSLLGCTTADKERTDLQGSVGFQSIGSYLSDGPVLVDGSMYVVTGVGSVHQIDPASGEILWASADSVGGVSGQPVVLPDAVLVMTYTGEVVSIDKASGAVQWRAPGDEGWALSGEAVDSPENARCFGYDPASDTAVMAGANGMVLGVNASDGSLRWARNIGANVFAAPAVAGGAVFINTMGGQVFAIEAADGSDRWELPKVDVMSVTGKITEIGGEGEPAGTRLELVVTVAYNFEGSDHFGHEGETVEVAFFDGSQPIKFVGDEGEITSLTLSHIIAEEHAGSASRVTRNLKLAAPPASETGWAVRAVATDGSGAELDVLEALVSFSDDAAPVAAPAEPAAEPAGAGDDDSADEQAAEELAAGEPAAEPPAGEAPAPAE